MKFKIHRGTKEIGGSCVEVQSKDTRILLDFGMPLIDRDGKEFDFGKYKDLEKEDLIKQGVLPDIKGLYYDTGKLIDGVIISHSHKDHYGLSNFINKEVKIFMGQATRNIINLNNIFTSQKIYFENISYFENEKTFKIGDFSVTPYWVDHSAFDSYSFLIEADGKRIFYSGDFRNHGRKSKVFKWFIHNAPRNVDYLLLEGTTINRENKPFKTETGIENELVKVFKQKDKINLIYTSGQNIDRLVSIYRACIKTQKILVVDVYVATVLKELSGFAKIPFPSENYKNLKVMSPYFTSRKLKNEGNDKILYSFAKYKITKAQINQQYNQIVMIVRPSMQKDLEHINEIDGGNLIYSMWEGYLQKPETKIFLEYLLGRYFTLHKIHTSGHADTNTLMQMVEAIKPKNIVPIHTFFGSEYKKIFTSSVIELKDGEEQEV